MLHLKLLHPLQFTITHTSRPVDGVTLVEYVHPQRLKTILVVCVLLGIMAVIVKVNKFCVILWERISEFYKMHLSLN